MLKMLQAKAPAEVRVSELLLQALPIVEPARPFSFLHASALTNSKSFCPREVVLSKKLGRKGYPQTIGAAMRITYDEGRDKQRRFNNFWFRDRMVGYWGCDGCGAKSEWGKAPKYNSGCKQCRWEYREVVFFHPSGTQGSLDAILDVARLKLHLVEVKIIAPDEWDKLKAPLAEHRVRSQVYLQLIAESSFPYRDQINTDLIHVLYFLRGHGRKDDQGRIHPIKEFIVQRDDASVARYFAMATAVTVAKGLDWEVSPEGICDSLFDKRAYSCGVCKECFSGQYPAEIKWKA
jgi:hypothetical protein